MAAAAPNATTTPGRVEYLTFSLSVELPGVVLERGTYVFEVISGEIGRYPMNVIRVRNRSNDQVVFQAPARFVVRPAGLSDRRSILVSESRPGATAQIVGWYPIGQTKGHEFVYTK